MSSQVLGMEARESVLLLPFDGEKIGKLDIANGSFEGALPLIKAIADQTDGTQHSVRYTGGNAHVKVQPPLSSEAVDEVTHVLGIGALGFRSQSPGWDEAMKSGFESLQALLDPSASKAQPRQHISAADLATLAHRIVFHECRNSIDLAA